MQHVIGNLCRNAEASKSQITGASRSVVASKVQRAITCDFPVISDVTPQKSLVRWTSFQTLLEEPQRFKQAAKKEGRAKVFRSKCNVY